MTLSDRRCQTRRPWPASSTTSGHGSRASPRSWPTWPSSGSASRSTPAAPSYPVDEKRLTRGPRAVEQGDHLLGANPTSTPTTEPRPATPAAVSRSRAGPRGGRRRARPARRGHRRSATSREVTGAQPASMRRGVARPPAREAADRRLDRAGAARLSDADPSDDLEHPRPAFHGACRRRRSPGPPVAGRIGALAPAPRPHRARRSGGPSSGSRCGPTSGVGRRQQEEQGVLGRYRSRHVRAPACPELPTTAPQRADHVGVVGHELDQRTA